MPMFLFYFSIILAICSSALYHFTAKSTPANVNFTVSLLVTYAVAFATTLFTFFFFPVQNGVMVTVIASLILVPVAIFIFKDKISWVNVLGIFVCLAGLMMLKWQR